MDTAPTPVRATLFAALDRVLAVAVEREARRLGPASLLDPWRGLHMGPEDVRATLAEAPHVPLAAEADAIASIAAPARADPQLGRVAEWLGLEDVDLAVLALAFAPEHDLRYERVYAYLQDDMTRRRPSPDLLARLLCASHEDRPRVLRRFAPGMPLGAVLEIAGAADTSLLARAALVAAPWRNHLLGRDELEPALARCARLVNPGPAGLDDLHADPEMAAVIKQLALAAVDGAAGLRLVFVGPHGAGKTALACALAHHLGLRILDLDLRDGAEIRDTLERARLAAGLLGALLYVRGAGMLAQRDPQLARALADTLAASPGWFVLSLTAPLPQMHAGALFARTIALKLPSAGARANLWRAALAGQAIETDEADVERIATRFRLSAAQIEQAAADLVPLAGGASRASGRALSAAARGLCGEELARLAQRTHPAATFDTLVATPDTQAQLREICARVANREIVERDWTRGCVHARNRGVAALFTGPSGTGKTLAAEVVAGELGYDLFRIDLSAVVSKYIGETEKNLDRVFAAAENANAVLFFDEADALFGKRSEVKDAHDRYANIEISYLLQKMEQFEGLAILATNLKQNLDEAFARRLTFSVNFAFPEAPERRRLWETLWPPNAPRADDVDFDWLAREYALSGGNIRNTVLAAVHLAISEGEAVGRRHLLHATRREYQKLGKQIATPAAVVRSTAP